MGSGTPLGEAECLRRDFSLKQEKRLISYLGYSFLEKKNEGGL